MSIRDEIVEALKGGKKSTAELAEATGKTETQIDSLLELLESKSVIVKNGGGKWKLSEAETADAGDRSEEVLALIKEKGPQRSAEIQQALGLEKRDARNQLLRMQKGGLLEVQGLAKASRWHLASGGKRAAAKAVKASPVRRARANGHTQPATEAAPASSPASHASDVLVMPDVRAKLLERKRYLNEQLKLAQDLALARLEEVESALAACGT